MKTQIVRSMLRCVAAASLLVLAAPVATAGKLPPLNKVQVPLPPNIDDFVIDRDAAIQLGKALFWEEQTAGDGRVACATCHFQAGADVRTTNTVNPRANGFFTTIPVNATLTLADFPIENGDVVGSQGVTKSLFNSIVLGDAVDGCTPVFDPLFNDGGLNVRQVTGRNAPSNFNAIFNFRSFWDGRANNEFNGVTPAGPTDPTNPTVLMVGPDNSLTPVAVSIPGGGSAQQRCRDVLLGQDLPRTCQEAAQPDSVGAPDGASGRQRAGRPFQRPLKWTEYQLC